MSKMKGYQVFGLGRTGPSERLFEPLNGTLTRTSEECIKLANEMRIGSFVVVEFDVHEITNQPKYATGNIVACNICVQD